MRSIWALLKDVGESERCGQPPQSAHSAPQAAQTGAQTAGERLRLKPSVQTASQGPFELYGFQL